MSLFAQGREGLEGEGRSCAQSINTANRQFSFFWWGACRRMGRPGNPRPEERATNAHEQNVRRSADGRYQTIGDHQCGLPLQPCIQPQGCEDRVGPFQPRHGRRLHGPRLGPQMVAHAHETHVCRGDARGCGVLRGREGEAGAPAVQQGTEEGLGDLSDPGADAIGEACVEFCNDSLLLDGVRGSTHYSGGPPGAHDRAPLPRKIEGGVDHDHNERTARNGLPDDLRNHIGPLHPRNVQRKPVPERAGPEGHHQGHHGDGLHLPQALDQGGGGGGVQRGGRGLQRGRRTEDFLPPVVRQRVGGHDQPVECGRLLGVLVGHEPLLVSPLDARYLGLEAHLHTPRQGFHRRGHAWDANVGPGGGILRDLLRCRVHRSKIPVPHLENPFTNQHLDNLLKCFLLRIK
mmetsp:Transcript_19490/g.34592  ORF Transcript_19490/g.34592 Transcript_19490/m.34592 type:complete len:403 (-) Transcript_19490:201-1409(-)